MKKIIEIERSIRLLIKYPHTFDYAEFGDKGSPCVKNLDRMTIDENIDYAESYAAVLQAMPKYSELYKQFAPVLMKELGLRQWPRYDYTVKILARILGDDTQIPNSDTVEHMCLFTARVQNYLVKTDRAELTVDDLAKIEKEV